MQTRYVQAIRVFLHTHHHLRRKLITVFITERGKSNNIIPSSLTNDHELVPMYADGAHARGMFIK